MGKNDKLANKFPLLTALLSCYLSLAKLPKAELHLYLAVGESVLENQSSLHGK